MATIKLWERPILIAILVEGKELTVEMVPVVREHLGVFPKELPRLP